MLILLSHLAWAVDSGPEVPVAPEAPAPEAATDVSRRSALVPRETAHMGTVGIAGVLAADSTTETYLGGVWGRYRAITPTLLDFDLHMVAAWRDASQTTPLALHTSAGIGLHWGRRAPSRHIRADRAVVGFDSIYFDGPRIGTRWDLHAVGVTVGPRMSVGLPGCERPCVAGRAGVQWVWLKAPSYTLLNRTREIYGPRKPTEIVVLGAGLDQQMVGDNASSGFYVDVEAAYTAFDLSSHITVRPSSGEVTAVISVGVLLTRAREVRVDREAP